MKNAKDNLKFNLKRIVATLLVALMIFVQVPWNAFAEDADVIEKEEEISVKLNEEKENADKENAKTEKTEEDKEDAKEEIKETANDGKDSKDEEVKGESKEVEENKVENVETETTKGTEDKSEELEEKESAQPQTRNAAKAPTRSTLNEENQFKVNLRWAGTSNTTYQWDAEEKEKRVIKLTFYYQNEVTPKAYEPGDLVVTIPGIGRLNRSSIKKASDIAADPYGATELHIDWSYTYD